MAIELLLKETYTIRDATTKREPYNFTLRMLRTIKDVRIKDVLP